MAKSKSPKPGGPTEEDDKIAVDGTPEDQSAEPVTESADQVVLPEPAKKSDAPIADTPQPDITNEDDSEDASVVDSDATETPLADADTSEEEPAEQDPAAPESDRFVPAVQPQQNSNPFWPLVLGGVVAACLGFVAGKSQIIDPILPQSWRSAGESAETTASLEAMDQTVSQLRGDIDTLRGQITDVPAEDNSETLNALNTSVEELIARIDALEQRPQAAPDATGSADVSALTDQMAAQQEQIDKLLEDAQLMQETATATAGNTLARAAATRVLAAVDSGAPFATALADVGANSDIEIPDALQRVADDGVTPLSDLQQALPDAARAALAAARTNASDGSGGFGGFLKRQLGARSVQPREGNDPDAILSRVEAATRQGRLADALAEADALPEPAKVELQSWMDAAQTRLEAMNAAEALIQRLAAN